MRDFRVEITHRHLQSSNQEVLTFGTTPKGSKIRKHDYTESGIKGILNLIYNKKTPPVTGEFLNGFCFYDQKARTGRTASISFGGARYKQKPVLGPNAGGVFGPHTALIAPSNFPFQELQYIRPERVPPWILTK